MNIKIKTNNSIDTINIIQKKECSLKKYDINVIIRTKNEAVKIKECLDAIFNQKCNKSFIVSIIDSGSTDSTLKIINNYDINLYQIESKDFNFGTSMQLGIEISKAKYTVFISGHAIPVNNNWLQLMIDGLDLNNVAAVYGKQTYKKDVNLLERINLESTFGNQDRIQKWNNKYKKYSDYKMDILFSNANSCIKTEIALKYPFSKISASEDREWAMRVLKAGFDIKYLHKASVYHYHNEDYVNYYKRIFINSKALYNFTGVSISILYIPIITLYKSFKDILYALKHQLKFSIINVFHYRYLYALAHYNGTRKEL